MTLTSGTARSRHGGRRRLHPVKRTRSATKVTSIPKVTPTATVRPRTMATRPPAVNPHGEQPSSPAVPATATIRTMIVCVPDDLPREALTTSRLDRHFNVRGTLDPRFWTTPGLYPWQRSQMFALHKGRPAYCAGGPVRLLGLTAMRHAAGLGAGIRHQLWTTVVHGTRPATPWTAFLQRHLADPDKHPLRDSQAQFERQPRVLAIRMHNAVQPSPAGHLAVDELEMYQAGQVAYQHYSAATAVAADAVLTLDGGQLAPASDAFTDRIAYLEHAGRYLHALSGSQRLLAVAF